MSTTLRSRVLSISLVACLALVYVNAAATQVRERDRPSPTRTSELTPELEPATKAERAVRYALDMVGTPYRWGGESPGGFDCSGLVRWAYGQVGVDLPHNSYALYSEGRRVPVSSMRTGDLMFFEALGHVGLYLGNGRMVHSPQTGRSVEVVRLNATNYGARLIGARRVVAS